MPYSVKKSHWDMIYVDQMKALRNISQEHKAQIDWVP